MQVPAGVNQLELRLQYIAPARRSSERISITRSLLNVEWETVLLYPAGTAASGVRVQTRLKLPPGWQAATALRGPDGQAPAAADGQGDRVGLAPVTYRDLLPPDLIRQAVQNSSNGRAPAGR